MGLWLSPAAIRGTAGTPVPPGRGHSGSGLRDSVNSELESESNWHVEAGCLLKAPGDPEASVPITQHPSYGLELVQSLTDLQVASGGRSQGGPGPKVWLSGRGIGQAARILGHSGDWLRKPPSQPLRVPFFSTGPSDR